MGRSREFNDLAARFGGRLKPTEREKRPIPRRTFKQNQAFAAQRQREESQKHQQWHREGLFFEEARQQGARQAGSEPDGPHDKDSWRDAE